MYQTLRYISTVWILGFKGICRSKSLTTTINKTLVATRKIESVGSIFLGRPEVTRPVRNNASNRRVWYTSRLCMSCRRQRSKTSNIIIGVARRNRDVVVLHCSERFTLCGKVWRVKGAPFNLQGLGGGGLEYLSRTNYLFQLGLAARWKFQMLLHVYIL